MTKKNYLITRINETEYYFINKINVNILPYIAYFLSLPSEVPNRRGRIRGNSTTLTRYLHC